MEPRFTYRCDNVETNEPDAPPSDCSATYFEPQSGFYEHGEGATEEEAVEDLYRKLEGMGYDRSKLPTPKPE